MSFLFLFAIWLHHGLKLFHSLHVRNLRHPYSWTLLPWSPLCLCSSLLNPPQSCNYVAFLHCFLEVEPGLFSGFHVFISFGLLFCLNTCFISFPVLNYLNDSLGGYVILNSNSFSDQIKFLLCWLLAITVTVEKVKCYLIFIPFMYNLFIFSRNFLHHLLVLLFMKFHYECGALILCVGHLFLLLNLELWVVRSQYSG